MGKENYKKGNTGETMTSIIHDLLKRAGAQRINVLIRYHFEIIAVIFGFSFLVNLQKPYPTKYATKLLSPRSH